MVFHLSTSARVPVEITLKRCKWVKWSPLVWVSGQILEFSIVYVTIVLSELISVVATAVVKSNKKSPSKHFLRHVSWLCIAKDYV